MVFSEIAQAHDDLVNGQMIREPANLTDTVAETQYNLCTPSVLRRLMMSNTLFVAMQARGDNGETGDNGEPIRHLEQ
jgi:hypothetical protein